MTVGYTPYLPVRIEHLPTHESYSFPLYLNLGGRYFPARDTGQPMDSPTREELTAKGAQWTYIRENDHPDFLRLLFQSGGGGPEKNRIRYLQEKFIPVEGQALRVNTLPDFYVFSLQADWKPVPTLAHDLVDPGPQVLDAHVQSSNLFIAREDAGKYTAYLNKYWGSEADFANLNFAGGVLIRNRAMMAAHALFHEEDPLHALQRARALVEEFLSIMRDNPQLYYALLKVSEQLFSTYIHSVNMAVLAMGFGMSQQLGEEALIHLGMAGLLHDVGMRQVDPTLVLSPGPFSPSEKREVAGHVRAGEAFCDQYREMVPQAVKRLVVHHHERLDGRGYPFGRKESDLSEQDQTLALMEVYDALTHARPHRGAYTPYQAIVKIINMGNVMEKMLLKTFIDHLGSQQSVERPQE